MIQTLTPSASAADGPIRHVVHFKFKPDTTPEKLQEVIKEFTALKGSISEIAEFESGTDISPEGLSKGFKHVWVLTFKNAADRDVYLVHPAHQKFVSIVKPTLEDVFVVDYIPTVVK